MFNDNFLNRQGFRQIIFYTLSIACLFFSCRLKTNLDEAKSSTQKDTVASAVSYNPVIYFEIPVNDLTRAKTFYSTVFDVVFEDEVIDRNEMALFPFSKTKLGISGALAKGSIYKPTKDGVVIYFRTESIDETLALAVKHGAHILYPKTSNGALGFVAEFEDCEGNRIALHESL